MKGRKRTKGAKAQGGTHEGNQGAGIPYGMPMAAHTGPGMAKGGGKGRKGAKMRRGAY